MNCEFCNKTLSNKGALLQHQKNTKYCLQIQGKISNNYTCAFCDSNYTTNQYLINHEKKCKDNNMENIKQKLLKTKEYEETIKNLESEISSLKGAIKVYEKNQDCLHEIAKNPKTTNNTTNNTKILNIQTPLDFNNKEKLQNIINEKYNSSYLHDGQKGVAKFAVDHILKDEQGDLSYICTDPSRYVFKYKDINGGLVKDLEAKKLTNALIDNGLEHKSNNMFINLWTDEEGKVDGKKCSELISKASDIINLKEDNTEFKRQLVNMTCK
jgi:hypothetical protein